jgi:methylenetetrahydrofolate dehydrogenase (NADP+) / methenyltetrahydrofolate cyclohydrolase
MMLLNGKQIADQLLALLKEKVSSLQGRKPGIGFLLIGNHPPSHSYVRMKKKACQRVGIESFTFSFDENVEESKIIDWIHELNHDERIDGILIQLPLPRHLNTERLVETIDPKKDIDGLHPINMGRLLLGEERGFKPCTPSGIKLLLEKSGISIASKHVVIMGRSNIVGKPLAALLVQNKKDCNATVTLVHDQTRAEEELTRMADILIVAIGRPGFVKKEMVKEGAVVVDVGINRLPDGSIVGDVDFADVLPKVHSISPVPGGVGPMTIALLLQNTWKSYCERYDPKNLIF